MHSENPEVDAELLQATNALSKMVVESSTIRIAPKGSTLAVQYNLPRLPVPPLEQTLNKYLDTVRPLLTDKEFESTKQKVNEFKKLDGPLLQRLLEKRAEGHVNWLSDWWKEKGYLEERCPVVVNVSPGYFLSRQSYRDLKGQIEFAAKVVSGVLDYRKALDEQSIPVDTLGGKPLCMLQHFQILNACRIPGPNKDFHVCVLPGEPHQPKHINVMRNNHVFSVDVYNNQGEPLSTDQIQRQLEQCVNQSQTVAPPVGILTAMERGAWYQAYSKLVKDKTNKAIVENLKSSIFVLNLDGHYDNGSLDSDTYAALVNLHGGGSKAYSGNRWYDKTLQLTCNQDGYFGLTYEHVTAEGPAVGNLGDFLLDFIQNKKGSLTTGTAIPEPKRLNFNLSDKATEVINKSLAQHDAVVDNVVLKVLNFADYGKGFIKTQKLSPDAYIQVAFQVAFYRMYKKPTATYESGSLRRFQYGRTDTIRSCSIPSTAFAKAMDDPNLTNNTKVELLRKAVMAHRKYTDEVVTGNGIDRHLLGLKLIAMEQGIEVPNVLSDEAFKANNHFRLSTSQVSSKYDSFVIFGPVVSDGYGICYNPKENKILVAISSQKENPETDSEKMAAMISQSLLDMQKLLASYIPSKL